MASIVQVVGNSVVGGAERHVLDLVTGLRRLGHRVTVVCPRAGPLTDAFAEADVPVDLVEFVGPRPHDDYAFLPEACDRLERLFRCVRPDVVHSHLYPAHLHATTAAVRAGIPAVLTTAHTLVVRPGDVELARTSRAHVIACSRAVADRLRTAGVPPGRISVIRNGVGPQHLVPAAPDCTAREGVLAVSRLSREKGVDLLLAAAERVAEQRPGTTIAVAGTGPEEERLRRRCDELSLTRTVSFLGVRHDVSELLRRAAVFVSPSREEAAPLAVLEAMAAGAAVVATAVGGTPEVVKDGETGILVHPDSGDLAAGLLRLLSDSELRCRLGSAARAAVLREHTLQEQVQRTARLYERQLGGGHR